MLVVCSRVLVACGPKTKQKYLVPSMISTKDRKRRNGELEQSIMNKAKKERMGKNANKCSSAQITTSFGRIEGMRCCSRSMRVNHASGMPLTAARRVRATPSGLLQ